MKKLFVILVIIVAFTACKTSQRDKGKLRHVVLFAWNEEADEAKVDELVGLFEALGDKLDFVDDFEYGEDVSVEKIHRGFTHAFILTFKNESDRNRYLLDKDHKAFGRSIKPYMKQVLVVDYYVH